MKHSLTRHYFTLFAKHRLVSLAWLLTPVIISLVIGFFQPVLYRSASNLLLVQKQNAVLDAYTAARAAERAGQNLVEVFDSASFRNRVWAIVGEETKKQFGATEEEIGKRWEKRLSVKLAPDTSILRVSVYAPTLKEAVALNAAIDQVFIKNNADYLSTNGELTVSEIDAPLAKTAPARPDFALNALIGLAAGLVLTGLYLVNRSWKEDDIFHLA